MLHVWQPSLNSALKVWSTDNNSWRLLANWQAVYDNYDDRSVCLYVPSQLFLHLISSLPAAQLKQLGTSGQQYLFEDIALTPVEQLRVRTLANSYNDEHLLYATAINDITSWQNSAEMLGFDVATLLPDFVLLPVPVPSEGALQGTKITLYYDNQTTLLRQSESLGFAVGFFPLLLKSLPQLQEVDLLYSAQNNSTQHDENSLSDNRDIHSDSTFTAIYDTLNANGIVIHSVAAQPKPIQSPHRHPLNFVEKVNQSKFSPYLKIAMLTALCAGVVQMSADALQIYQYQQAQTQVIEATNQQFSSWVQGQSLNPRVEVMTQMRPYLITDGADESAQLATLEHISPLIKQSAISTQSLRWDDKEITLLLISPERQSLDRLIRVLKEQGVQANLGRIEARSDGAIVGEVRVSIESTTPKQPA